MPAKIAIVGAGPAGCFAACHLDKSFDITIFDINSPLKTLLPTGGGKCNLAHAEYDFKNLAKCYPRGEKFLYSVFSRFATSETLEFFEKIGVNTYTRDDGRIFPIENSSQFVRTKILQNLRHCKFNKSKVNSVRKLDCGFELSTDNEKFYFDKIIFATGGKSAYKILQNLGHKIVEPRPSLVALKTAPSYKGLQGVSVRNCKIMCNKKEYFGDILFTNEGLTGPVIFEISSVNARESFPYNIVVDFLNSEINFQGLFDANPHKNLGNVLSEFLPKSVVNTLIDEDLTQKCSSVRSNTKELIRKSLKEAEFSIIGTKKEGETVTSGGVSLDEINSSTMESKKMGGFYICGEVADVDGFCGGYNLQFCWSSGYLAAISVNADCKIL